MIPSLSQREIRFCDELIIRNFNGTQAAIAAGYSKKTAASIASENLRKPKIQKYIAARMKKVLQKIEISQERTMLEIGRIAFADPRTLFNEDGSLIPIPNLPDDQAATIASFEQEELFEGRGKDKVQTGSLKKLKMWNKTEALSMLAKHFRIFEEAPQTPQVNLVNLDTKDLKTLLELKKKAGQ